VCHYKPREHQDIYIVTEIYDTKRSETRLPRDNAIKLFKKIASAGGNVTIEKEMK